MLVFSIRKMEGQKDTKNGSMQMSTDRTIHREEIEREREDVEYTDVHQYECACVCALLNSVQMFCLLFVRSILTEMYLLLSLQVNSSRLW